MESGEAPIPQQKTEEAEVSQQQERRSVFRWLRNRGLLIYMTAALAAVAPFKHERMEAAEIPPNATWSEGIDVLHKGALSDRYESYGLFDIDNQDKRSTWIIRKEGKFDYVDIGPETIAVTAEREIAGKYESSVTLCDIHNHILDFARYDRRVSDKEFMNIQQGKQAVSIAPSGDEWEYGDVSPLRYEAIDSALDKITNKGVAVEIRFGVVDPAGIMYYRAINDQELEQEYPDHYQDIQQGRALRRVWDETIKPILDKPDAAKLNELHNRFFLQDEYKNRQGSVLEILELKQQDIITRLLTGGLGYEDILRELLADRQKLQEDFKAMVTMRNKDISAISNARVNWTIKSLGVSPEELTSTKEYSELREAYTRNGTKIRFVPHSKVADEPPCAGTDYKP